MPVASQPQVLSSPVGVPPRTERWNSESDDSVPNSPQASTHVNTFRQPLPPGIISRPQRIVAPPHQILRPGNTNKLVQQQYAPRSIIMSPDIRQRFVRPPVNLLASNNSGQQIIVQQQAIVQHQQYSATNTSQQVINEQQVVKQTTVVSQQVHQVSPSEANETIEAGNNQSQSQNGVSSSPANISNIEQQSGQNMGQEPAEIPDNVTAELEKLEDENAAIGEVEGVNDILGDLGEDDDDELLNSLTAEMGADFNILEYADPELDALNEGDQANLLDSLDFDDSEPEKDKGKKDSMLKYAAAEQNKASQPGNVHSAEKQGTQTTQATNNMHQNKNTQISNAPTSAIGLEKVVVSSQSNYNNTGQQMSQQQQQIKATHHHGGINPQHSNQQQTQHRIQSPQIQQRPQSPMETNISKQPMMTPQSIQPQVIYLVILG